MSDNLQNMGEISGEIPQEERDADSVVDMWSAVALVLLAWAVAIFWMSGQ